MKCIKLTSSKQIARTSDEVAKIMVKEDIGVYTSKSSWKASGRKYFSKIEEKAILMLKEKQE